MTLPHLSTLEVRDFLTLFGGAEVRWGDATVPELTIASGVISLADLPDGFGSMIQVDTESDAASDDLVTINGGTAGQLLLLRNAADTRTVVVKGDESGNISAGAGGDIRLDDGGPSLLLLRFDGTNWYPVAMAPNGPANLATAIPDDGDASAILGTKSGICALTSAGAETRTLAIPSFVGQRIGFVHDTDGGSIAITVASAFNEAGNTVLTFTDAGESCELVGMTVGGTLAWRLGSNDGVALS
jgi:hypothetical protein